MSFSDSDCGLLLSWGFYTPDPPTFAPMGRTFLVVVYIVSQSPWGLVEEEVPYMVGIFSE